MAGRQAKGMQTAPPPSRPRPAAPAPPMPMKTANWAGNPGKGSPDRSAGIKKAPVSPKSSLT